MRIVLIAIYLLSSLYCHGQVVPVQGVPVNPIDQSIFSQWASEVDSETSGSVISGSPYLLDDWAKGELKTIKGDNYTAVDLKVNLFTGKIIYRNPFTKDSTLIHLKFLDSYLLNGKDSTFAFHYIPPSLDQKSKVRSSDFYLILLEGKNTLLGRPEVRIKRATKNSMINSDGQIKDRYYRNNLYFIRDENGAIKKINGTKKAFARSLPVHNDTMLLYLKKGNFDLQDPEDLKTIIEHYNNL